MVLAKDVPRSAVILKDLLRSGLPFKAVRKDTVLHNTHDFEARSRPSVPRLFIEALTRPEEVVLDPMCGAGTALIEAARLGRGAIGADLDPLAVKLSRMKTSRIDPGKARTVLHRIVNHAFIRALDSPFRTHQFLQGQYSEESVDLFYDRFGEEPVHQLASLVQEIGQIEEPELRNFFEVIFSSIIPTEKNCHSAIYSPVHFNSRWDFPKRARNAIRFYLEKGVHALASLEEFRGAPGHASVVAADCRNLPVSEDSIELVFCSPPGLGATGAMDAHRPSLSWLGYDPASLQRQREGLIGTQTLRGKTELLLRVHPEIVPEVPRADRHTACLLGQYVQDLAEALSEMRRVLKTGRAAVVLARPSAIRDLTIPTHEIIGALSETLGFQWVGTMAVSPSRHARPLDTDQPSNGNHGRAHQEYVIGLVKV